MSIGSGIEEKINDWFAAKAGINCIRGHFFYKPALGRDSIVVDLGGNKGSFSKGISEMFRCKVFAVEPEPNLFRQIPEMEGVKKFSYAISGEDSPVTLYLSDNPEANTIDPGIQKIGEHKQSVTVQGKTLENFLKEIGIASVDLLKVDIEGAEIAMFKSVGDDLLRNIKQISIEAHAFLRKGDEAYAKPYSELTQRLKKTGFDLSPFGRKSVDMLFLNKKSMKIKFIHRLFTYPAVFLQFLLLLTRGAKGCFLSPKGSSVLGDEHEEK